MSLTSYEWHSRFTQQALWTSDLRRYIFDQINVSKYQRILEVGCGTGATLTQLPSTILFKVGLDINDQYLSLAMRNNEGATFIQGDGHSLPCLARMFDITLCHFLLLWTEKPTQVVSEMARVTRPGGTVIALAEPDYGGRIDFPHALTQLGQWQTSSLQKQGADPTIGRKLAGIFHQAGLESIQTGVLGGQWSETPDWDQWELEWTILESDLGQEPIFSRSFRNLKELDKNAYIRGERILFVPTFYAWGQVPITSE
ncbi:MAG: class I SAM-dependent methyltransferase [Anaerolineales bacterium]